MTSFTGSMKILVLVFVLALPKDSLLSLINKDQYPSAFELNRMLNDARRNSSHLPLMRSTDLGLPSRLQVPAVLRSIEAQCSTTSKPCPW